MTTKTKTTENSNKIAVIRTGGRQFVVREGDIVKIEKLPTDEKGKDGKVSFETLLIADSSDVKIGTPNLKDQVVGEFIEDGRDKKVEVIHYRAKSRYFKKAGHRQPFSKVKITKIS